MIKLISRWVRNFLWSEKAAAASLRSFITFLAAGGAIVVASASDATGHVNYQIIEQWNLKAWVIRWAFAALFAAAARIPAGEKNMTRDEIRAIVKEEAKP